MDRDAFLAQELAMLMNKKDNDLQWIDINNFRRENLGVEETVDTTRKGYKLLAEFLENGWELRPVRDPKIGKCILAISDIHYPFHLPVDVYAKYAGKVDVLVLGGDLLDCTSISKFPKIGRANQIDEMIGLRSYLLSLVEMLKPKKVLAIMGNHEARLTSYIVNAFGGSEMQELVPESLLSYIFNDGFYHYNKNEGTKVWYRPLREVWMEENVDLVFNDTWWIMEGDIMFCHPKAYSTAPMKTAIKAVEFFHCLGTPNPMKVMCMAHTHRAGFYRIGSVDVYEQGACCDVSKLHYNDGMLINPQKEGFILFYQDKDGNTLNNYTEQITLN